MVIPDLVLPLATVLPAVTGESSTDTTARATQELSGRAGGEAGNLGVGRYHNCRHNITHLIIITII